MEKSDFAVSRNFSVQGTTHGVWKYMEVLTKGATSTTPEHILTKGSSGN
jgi:hypothetical protein